MTANASHDQKMPLANSRFAQGPSSGGAKSGAYRRALVWSGLPVKSQGAHNVVRANAITVRTVSVFCLLFISVVMCLQATNGKLTADEERDNDARPGTRG
jgi:hypothetical protein